MEPFVVLVLACLVFAFGAFAWVLRLYRKDHITHFQVVCSQNEWMSRMVETCVEQMSRMTNAPTSVVPSKRQLEEEEAREHQGFDLEWEAEQEEARRHGRQGKSSFFDLGDLRGAEVTHSGGTAREEFIAPACGGIAAEIRERAEQALRGEGVAAGAAEG